MQIQHLNNTWHTTLCMKSQPAEGWKIRLSEQERRVDALALRADERRDKLR